MPTPHPGEPSGTQKTCPATASGIQEPDPAKPTGIQTPHPATSSGTHKTRTLSIPQIGVSDCAFCAFSWVEKKGIRKDGRRESVQHVPCPPPCLYLFARSILRWITSAPSRM